MRVSAILYASIVTLAAALTVGGASAVTTVKGCKSNINERTCSTATADDARACTDKGGKVYTAANGDKICVLPGAKVTTVSGSKSNTNERTASGVTEKQCTDKGGQVLTGSDRSQICLMPGEPGLDRH